MNRLSAPTSRRAFTLVELIAAIVVIAVIGSLASVLLASAVDGYSRASIEAQLHSELSIALERIEREWRYIPCKADQIAPHINSISATSMVWSDDCSLSLVGDRLMFAVNGGAAGVLLDDVAAVSIQGMDDAGSPLSLPRNGDACDAIRRLQVSITLERNGVSQTLRTIVFIRSMMQGASG